jgi:2-keto-4-pentenoate hydratase/2-oxohepta-3-ene-1,7-dioic acid hydratase in catechol pathway
MRFATVVADGRMSSGVLRDGRFMPLDPSAPGSLRALARGGVEALDHVRGWVERQPPAAWRPLDDVALGPAVPDPGAIYTIGLNYPTGDEPPSAGPQRPLVYGKAPTSVAGPAVLTWDRELTENVDAECELGVVIGRPAAAVSSEDAMGHVFGYTIINDISSRDPWLDGDQWLLGKSMPGFCPVGPSVVTPDEIAPDRLRLGCTINGIAIQDGTTADMRFSVAEIISFLSRHLTLQPGDLIATGTPARLAGPLGPERHLEPGDVVTVWIEKIGELTTTIARPGYEEETR